VISVDTRPRVGFLGVGWIGRRRLDAIAHSGLAQIAALADPAVEGALPSLGALLEQELDGIVIATPSALHAPQTLAALERGLAVFCQKPLALDAPSAQRVVDAACTADRLLALDLSYRFTEAAQRVREVVAGGELGDVFAVELAFHNAYGPERGWSGDPALAGGGCVLDLGIHLVDLALWTLDFPAVTAVTGNLDGTPLEHYASAELALASGAVVRLACSWWLHAGRECVLEASFYGEHGGVSLRNVDGSFYDFVADRYRGAQTERLAGPPDDWGGRAAVAWARRVAEGERFDAAAEEYVRVHEVLDGIYGRHA
jgi:predicted dehydrogenase